MFTVAGKESSGTRPLFPLQCSRAGFSGPTIPSREWRRFRFRSLVVYRRNTSPRVTDDSSRSCISSKPSVPMNSFPAQHGLEILWKAKNLESLKPSQTTGRADALSKRRRGPDPDKNKENLRRSGESIDVVVHSVCSEDREQESEKTGKVPLSSSAASFTGCLLKFDPQGNFGLCFPPNLTTSLNEGLSIRNPPARRIRALRAVLMLVTLGFYTSFGPYADWQIFQGRRVCKFHRDIVQELKGLQLSLALSFAHPPSSSCPPGPALEGVRRHQLFRLEGPTTVADFMLLSPERRNGDEDICLEKEGDVALSANLDFTTLTSRAIQTFPRSRGGVNDQNGGEDPRSPLNDARPSWKGSLNSGIWRDGDQRDDRCRVTEEADEDDGSE
ncbi:hypothetical protein R3P38DRAFT_2779764 [Favolaschia claudopus]|uniref:Transmembrane protein n=1 Tax=Favolaschia claudopus TaxID=2862362 RepID=A0AAW0B9Z9_9AGAR